MVVKSDGMSFADQDLDTVRARRGRDEFEGVWPDGCELETLEFMIADCVDLERFAGEWR